jgi:hypothetical protein
MSDGQLLTIYPPAYRAWAAVSGTAPARLERPGTDQGPLNPTRSTPGDSRPALAIANPPAGAVYSVDPTLRREFQALPLSVQEAFRAQHFRVHKFIDQQEQMQQAAMQSSQQTPGGSSGKSSSSGETQSQSKSKKREREAA